MGFSSKNIKNIGLDKVIEAEGQKLFKLVQKYINAYYNSYSPSMYDRTDGLKDSLRIESFNKDGLFGMRIYFDHTLATHPSVLGGKDGFVPILINDGWQWSNGRTEPYRFVRYEGYGFIEKAIAEYNKSNKYGLQIRVRKKYNGNIIEDTSY